MDWKGQDNQQGKESDGITNRVKGASASGLDCLSVSLPSPPFYKAVQLTIPSPQTPDTLGNLDLLDILFPLTPDHSPQSSCQGNQAAQSNERNSSKTVDASSTETTENMQAFLTSLEYTVSSNMENTKKSTIQSTVGNSIISNILTKSLPTPWSPLSLSTLSNETPECIGNHAKQAKASVTKIPKVASQNPSDKVKSKPKAAGSPLKFPPCLVCSGAASGSHYGVNSCEACKGFFRRYMIRKETFKCKKGGKCEIINRNRGNCSGCRLQKCLELGMSKEKSKLGRYSLSKRTEAIKNANKLQGKEETDSVTEGLEQFPVNSDTYPLSPMSRATGEINNFDPDSEMISRTLNNVSISDPKTKVTFSDNYIDNLVKAMEAMEPYGPDIVTDDDLEQAFRAHHEKYTMKLEMYGSMKTVPKEEHYKLYKEYGIDIDGRVEMLKKGAEGLEGCIWRYCNFAKRIPEFFKLSLKDQSNLLKVSLFDFFLILMSNGFSEKYKVFITHNGLAYHLEECADKFESREFLEGAADVHVRWKKMKLTKAEMSLLIAVTLVFPDRCKLENYAQVEKMQLSLLDSLRKQLELTDKTTAQSRFAKIIDNLTYMRGICEMYFEQFKQMCKDEIVIEELPMITEFLLEEY